MWICFEQTKMTVNASVKTHLIPNYQYSYYTKLITWKFKNRQSNNKLNQFSKVYNLFIWNNFQYQELAMTNGQSNPN